MLPSLKRRLNSFRYFIMGAQASGAQVKPFYLAVDGDSSWMNVGYPAPVGAAFGMAGIMTKLRCFPA